MELEVGIYVRTNLGIAKITAKHKSRIGNEFLLDKEIIDTHEDYYTNCMYDYRFYLEQIIKTSHNIIDLIEVGDIIEFKELRTHLTNESGTKFYNNYIVSIFNEEELKVAKEEIEGKHMKLLSIVTKEQFEAMAYKVV